MNVKACASLVCIASAVGGASARAEAPNGRYLVDDQTVTDTKTKLIWQRTPDASERSYAEAVSYCRALDVGGTGFRLPSIKELLTIVDESRWSPAIDPSAFPGTPPEYFWSSSFLANFPNFVWTVYFGKGTAAFFDTKLTRYVRCVR